jgi:hypothetical protein
LALAPSYVSRYAPGNTSSYIRRNTVTAEKTRETRLRRMAERQGLALHKSRRRDPFAKDYGQVWLRWLDSPTPERLNDAWIGPFENLDEVERWFAIDPDERPVTRTELGDWRGY